MYEALTTLLARRNQRFGCCTRMWPEPGPILHTASIRHEVDPPLDAGTLAALEAQLPEVPEVVAFYRQWGSARLYCDTVFREPIGHASAFYIAPPDEWPQLREDFEDWLDNLDEDEREECLPAWLADYIVPAKVPNSGNYFLVPLKGEHRGKVFEFEHDGFEFIERAAGFEAFVDSLATVTDELLHEIMGHTRYADTESDTQWLCREYMFDEDEA